MEPTMTGLANLGIAGVLAYIVFFQIKNSTEVHEKNMQMQEKFARFVEKLISKMDEQSEVLKQFNGNIVVAVKTTEKVAILLEKHHNEANKAIEIIKNHKCNFKNFKAPIKAI